MPWWMPDPVPAARPPVLPSPPPGAAAASRPAPPPRDPAPAPVPAGPAPDALDLWVARKAPATLISTAASSAVHVRLHHRSHDHVELLLGSPTLDPEAFGPLASVILVVAGGDQTHVLTGRVDGAPRRQGRGRVLAVHCHKAPLAAEARQEFRVPVAPQAGLQVELRDARGTVHPFAPSNISRGGIGGLLPGAPDRSLAPGTTVRLTLAWDGAPLSLAAEVRMRQLARADQPPRVGLRFALPAGPEGAAQAERVAALVAHAEAHHLGTDGGPSA